MQHDGLNPAEHRGIRAYAQRQHQRRGGGEPRVSPVRSPKRRSCQTAPMPASREYARQFTPIVNVNKLLKIFLQLATGNFPRAASFCKPSLFLVIFSSLLI